jgi:hypothetical protein
MKMTLHGLAASRFCRLFNLIASIRPLTRLTHKSTLVLPVVLGLGLVFTPQPGYCDNNYLGSVNNAINQVAIIANSGPPRAASLPPCNMDSFVMQAGGLKEQIYGDEGTTSKPPLASFTKASRINAGIVGVNNAGLTTGHGSYLPDASGADEFISAGGEWDMSGINSGASGGAPASGSDDHRTKGLPGSTIYTVQQMSSPSFNFNISLPSISSLSSLNPF